MPDTSDPAALSGWMKSLTGSLALAFNTTLVALLLSAVLVFLMHIAQGARGVRPEPGRAVLPGQPHQPSLREIAPKDNRSRQARLDAAKRNPVKAENGNIHIEKA